jgi:hypothetical protein
MLIAVTCWLVAMATFCYLLCVGSKRREKAELRAFQCRYEQLTAPAVRTTPVVAKWRPQLAVFKNSHQTRSITVNG